MKKIFWFLIYLAMVLNACAPRILHRYNMELATRENISVVYDLCYIHSGLLSSSSGTIMCDDYRKNSYDLFAVSQFYEVPLGK